MAKRRKVRNLLGLAVLSTVSARPMHPYEMAALMRARGKDRDMDIKWGSLYTVVGNLEKHGFLAVEGSWGKALALTAWGAVVIGLVDNLLYPSLVGNRLRLHTLVVFFAVVGGLSVFGAAGLFLGPALVTLGLELRRMWRVRARRGMADTVAG